MATTKKRQSGELYDKIRTDILTITLRPGEDIDELALAERYGTSRTPVREALIKLSADGLVKFGEKRGARVTVLILPDLPRFLEALDFHRRASCRLAALRRHDVELKPLRKVYDDFVKVSQSKGVGNDSLSAQVADHEMQLYVRVSEAGHNTYLTEAYSRLLTVGLRMMRLPFAYSPREGQSVQSYISNIIEEQGVLMKAIEEQKPDRAEKSAGRLHAMLVMKLREFNEENLLSGVSIV